MRPVRLEMTAFGPFGGTETVDFRSLGDSCFFLIHGPTGAGKTSILDGMCFALYGKGTGTERSASSMRSDFAPGDLPTQVVFDFSIGSESYRVSRRPKQDRPNANGSTSTILAQATLWRRTGAQDDTTLGDVLADGVQKVDEKVEGLLGFSVDQFRQVVMLPQGEFRKLLSANSTDREKILEDLFNAGLYRQLQEFLKGKKRGAEQELNEVHLKLAGVYAQLGVKDEDELSDRTAVARGTLIDARCEADVARAEAGEAARRLQMGRQVAALFDACVLAGDNLQQCLAALISSQQTFDQAAAALAAEHGRDAEREAARKQIAELENIAERATALSQAQSGLMAARAAAASAAERGARAVDSEAAARAAARAAADGVKEGLEAQARLPQLQSRLAEAAALSADLETLGRWQRRAEVRAEKVARTGAATAAAREERLRAAQALRTLQDQWRAGQAGVLARALVDGQPCPVCGSSHHPGPAVAAENAPGEEAVEAAQSELDRLDGTLAAITDRHQRAKQRLGIAEHTLKTLRARLGDQATADPATVAADIAALRAAVEPLAARVRSLPALESAAAAAQTALTDATRATEVLRQAMHDAELEESRLNGLCDERLKEVPEPYRDPNVLALAITHAKDRQRMLDQALQAAEAAKAAASDEFIRSQANEKTARKAAEEAATAIDGRQRPDTEALAAAADGTAERRDASLMEFMKAKAAHQVLRRGARLIAGLHAEGEARERRFRSIALLADMASGTNASNISFQRYVLALFLDEVLATATHRLLGMTDGRYQLHAAKGTVDRRKAGGLDLDVFDEFTGDLRPVGTLSGGEGFLASLALALALAEVVQRFSGGIRLDAVFIDEGFGTLSPEALDAAITTLLSLREHDRLVGVISHVPELRERIDCRLEVKPSKTGSTTEFVVP